ncbi:hypothetical protein N7541_009397 [Penicillium brevicompactum]|uniref:Glycosyl transferase family 1 domain-containing protein n=1 Tax=Penicillium brevicompactum TaxID=5074 RepID=A0A9W9QLS4_PENBR|nr:hypothetical protein N7541_009397 [Penicillium brevicompactum]
MPPNVQGFDRDDSKFQRGRVLTHLMNSDWSGPSFKTIYAGVSVFVSTDSTTYVAIAFRDATYLLDFIEHSFSDLATESNICSFIISELTSYRDTHMEKILGIGLPRKLHEKSVILCARLWTELDIVPVILDESGITDDANNAAVVHFRGKRLDEQADSGARKCIRFFGPNNLPFLQVGLYGSVEVDSGFRVRIADSYVPFTFFSIEVQKLTSLKYRYVPKPRPGVFRITKTNHNILQGVSAPEERLTRENQECVTSWIQENAKRYWLRDGGPLCHPSEGGADVIVVDDPQMPSLIPIAKGIDPQRAVIYRSHIQIRRDLIAFSGSPQAEVWDFLWQNIKAADLFISQPVSTFVPDNVPKSTVGYMPASTDWLDGLNKTMKEWDTGFYGRIFNHRCRDAEMPTINYPNEQYIVQIARFDPSKGIFEALRSYEKFQSLLSSSYPEMKVPKLLVCGHGSVDDPDGSIIYDAVLQCIENTMPHLAELICVMRLGPSDQMLNTILSKARIVLQLSQREGFEVKVSEAIHKGKPVIASRAGGIPLQFQHGKNGYLVEVGDIDAVAGHLLELWTDHDLYERIKTYSLSYVSDEVSTVGNALNWLYLASKLSRGQNCRPQEEWIQDMARGELNQSYTEDDGKLKRLVDEDR